jgi:hypothetical protein
MSANSTETDVFVALLIVAAALLAIPVLRVLWLTIRDIQSLRFSVRRTFMAITLVAFGLAIMTQLRTPSHALWIAASVAIGSLFGAATGLILNRPLFWTLTGACGWLLFAIYAVVE